MGNALLKVLFSELVRVITVPIRLLPIKKNRILFTGLTGGRSYDYSCNPKYVYEYMREHFPDSIEYVWAVDDIGKYNFLKEEGVKLVKHFTVSSFPMLLTAKVIVTNGSYAPWFPFRKKQYVINTWHGGGAYKKVENEKPDANWATRKRAMFCANNIDLFLASCKKQEESMIRTTYQYKGEVLREGTPRNDKLVQGNILAMQKRVRETYRIPENGKIVLYAPTYRSPENPVELDADALLDCLQGMDNREWFFFCRYHRYQDENMQIRVKGRNVIEVLDYPDMQELLAAADILITDYSSCVWDYAFLKRPCFLYVPDREEYIRKTGFYVDMEEWPFLQTKDMEALLFGIRHFNPRKEDVRVKEHLKALGSFEQGRCCERLAKIIARQCELMESSSVEE